RRDRDEDLGRADDLVARGVVLADPGLVVAQLVEPPHQLEVAVETRGRVFVHGMERGEEDPEAQRRRVHPSAPSSPSYQACNGRRARSAKATSASRAPGSGSTSEVSSARMVAPGAPGGPPLRNSATSLPVPQGVAGAANGSSLPSSGGSTTSPSLFQN